MSFRCPGGHILQGPWEGDKDHCDSCDVDGLREEVRTIRNTTLEEAAVEAEKTRIMLLTREQIADGILKDDHPVVRARKQMRAEVAKAIRGMKR